MKRALLLGALVACSDPGHYCGRDGEHITYNGTCSFAPSAITIDGDFSDWAALLAYPADCPDCPAGSVGAVYATTTTNGEVAIFAQTVGPPLTDASHSYLVAIGPKAGPYYSLAWRVRPTSTVAQVDYNVTLNGIPVKAAMGESGIELAAPISAMPFTAGGSTNAELDALDSFGGWQDTRDVFNHPVYSAPVCWDPGSPLCKPTN